MEWISNLFLEQSALQAIIVIAMIAAIGLALGKIHVMGVSLGVTLGYYKKVKAELRLNFEKYFYDDGVEIAPSDHDKLVAEIMFNF